MIRRADTAGRFLVLVGDEVDVAHPGEYFPDFRQDRRSILSLHKVSMRQWSMSKAQTNLTCIIRTARMFHFCIPWPVQAVQASCCSQCTSGTIRHSSGPDLYRCMLQFQRLSLSAALWILGTWRNCHLPVLRQISFLKCIRQRIQRQLQQKPSKRK